MPVCFNGIWKMIELGHWISFYPGFYRYVQTIWMHTNDSLRTICQEITVSYWVNNCRGTGFSHNLKESSHTSVRIYKENEKSAHWKGLEDIFAAQWPPLAAQSDPWVSHVHGEHWDQTLPLHVHAKAASPEPSHADTRSQVNPKWGLFLKAADFNCKMLIKKRRGMF